MSVSRNVTLPPLPSLKVAQRNYLIAAKAWWQEGERSLDYMAEKARQETLFAQIRPLADALRTDRPPSANPLPSLLQHARQLTGNRALNRTLETDDFALALQNLLWGETDLPTRLAAFTALPSVGATTAAHLLYVVFPERFSLVSPLTKAVISATREQKQQARLYTTALHTLTGDVPLVVRDILADFVMYESVLRLLGLSNYRELNAILWHAREMPRSGMRRPQAKSVQEDKAEYRATATVEESLPQQANEITLLNCIEQEIHARGFTFPALVIRNYYIALKAKPFAILTGLSGTGKTRLTRLLSDAITGGTNNQYLLLAVRPDWHDSTPLLGYQNILSDRYISTPFLEILHRAAQNENRERAFFICLDEMNLARVEHYFAEVLSAMETEEQQILLYEGRSTVLSPNLFLTGSVNMDEATHPFSRKVLDRANTIEFTEVTLKPADALPVETLPEIPFPERQRLFLANCVTTVQTAQTRLAAVDDSFPEQILATLTTLNELLTPRSMHFGYRVRDEVMRYAAAAFSIEGQGLLSEEPNVNLQTALDLQIVQKVLPRLTGTAEALERLLHDLESWANVQNLPRSAAKLSHMRRRALDDGFVTFYEL